MAPPVLPFCLATSTNPCHIRIRHCICATILHGSPNPCTVACTPGSIGPVHRPDTLGPHRSRDPSEPVLADIACHRPFCRLGPCAHCQPRLALLRPLRHPRTLSCPPWPLRRPSCPACRHSPPCMWCLWRPSRLGPHRGHAPRPSGHAPQPSVCQPGPLTSSVTPRDAATPHPPPVPHGLPQRHQVIPIRPHKMVRYGLPVRRPCHPPLHLLGERGEEGPAHL